VSKSFLPVLSVVNALGAAVLPGIANAAICAPDNVPAATLLLPYFGPAPGRLLTSSYPASARRSQTLADCQSRLTVAGETPQAAAVSSVVRPTK
jgi:hypothetical protein